MLLCVVVFLGSFKCTSVPFVVVSVWMQCNCVYQGNLVVILLVRFDFVGLVDKYRNAG